MAADFLSVKQDDRDVVAVTHEEFWILRDVHFLQQERSAQLHAAQDLLRPLAQMAIGLGVDCD